MKLQSLNLTKTQKNELKKFRNNYSKIWKRELKRFYNNQTSPLDDLYIKDKTILMSTKDVVLPIIDQLVIDYSGPDKD